MAKKPARNRDNIPAPMLLPSGGWLYRARDTKRGTYVNRTFHRDPKADFNRDRPGCASGDKWATEEAAKLNLGLSSSGSLLLTDLAKDYADDLKARGRTQKHIDDVKRILMEAAASGVDDIKADDVKSKVRRWLTGSRSLHYRSKGRKLCPSTRNRRLTVIKSAVRFAVGQDFLLRDVLFGVRPETDSTKGKLREAFTPAELRQMLSDEAREPWRLRTHTMRMVDIEQQKHNDDNAGRKKTISAVAKAEGVTPECIQKRLTADEQVADQWWLPVAVCAYTGCRLGEVAAMRWTWFDWDSRLLTIKQEKDFSPKRHQERRVPLLVELAKILKPKAQLSGHLFPWLKEMADTLRSRGVAEFIARSGVDPKGRGAHCLRHTWVSLRLALGVPSLTVMAEAGHRTILTTQVYAHAMPARWVEGWSGSGEFWLRRTINETANKLPEASS